MTRFTALLLISPALAVSQRLPADSVRGERLFESEHCIECHSIDGKGGHSATDLGRRFDRDFTPAALTSTMWNHAPTMWSAMRTRNVQSIHLDDQAAADLFAYFYSARFFEKPGDAGRGKRLFTGQSCAQCHGISDRTNPAARPVREWQSLGDAIALTTAMWNHSATMGTELTRKGIKLPEITGQDLTDLLVYLRNLPAARDAIHTFQTTAGSGGKELFESKGCAKCHPGNDAPAARRLKGQTLTDVAAQMWDHGLRIPAAYSHLEPSEMREVLSYVWAAQFFESTGDAGRGKRVFAAKRCATCHDQGTGGAPSLKHGTRKVSEITMVSALWRHGPTMLALMTEKKMPWPRFNAREMSDVIAYLNTRE
jgi:mono/diheme cytochrome c family protein